MSRLQEILRHAALERFVRARVVTAADALERAQDKETFTKIPEVARGLGTEG